MSAAAPAKRRVSGTGIRGKPVGTSVVSSSASSSWGTTAADAPRLKACSMNCVPLACVPGIATKSAPCVTCLESVQISSTGIFMSPVCSICSPMEFFKRFSSMTAILQSRYCLESAGFSWRHGNSTWPSGNRPVRPGDLSPLPSCNSLVC